MRRQGLKGAAIGGGVAGADFSDPKFHPVWAKAEELGAVLFIHPQGVPQLNQRLAGNGWLANAIGNPLETTIALSRLIFEGTLDRFPGLKIIAAHGGGYLPSYADRSDHACMVNPAGCDPAIALKKKPSEYLRQIWFDSLVFSPEAIRHLAAQVGAGQIVLGSDYPYPWQMSPVDHVFACDSLSDEGSSACWARSRRGCWTSAFDAGGLRRRPAERPSVHRAGTTASLGPVADSASRNSAPRGPSPVRPSSGPSGRTVKVADPVPFRGGRRSGAAQADRPLAPARSASGRRGVETGVVADRRRAR